MKKRIAMIFVVILLFVAIFILSYFVFTAPKYDGEFLLDDFSDVIESFPFPGHKTYGKIIDYKSAGEIGKNIIDEFYGGYSKGSIIEWMGCKVQYAPQHDVYYIRIYHISPLVIGGAYDIIIRSDGTVLAIWGEK